MTGNYSLLTNATVVKVGGSLDDLPDLGSRLRCWLDSLRSPRLLLIPGGGAAVEGVRRLDTCHSLGEDKAHWLALRVLSAKAHFLAALLSRSQVIEHLHDCPRLWDQGVWPILDGYTFARGDEEQPGALPHSWEVTSDSLAARVAICLRARRLVLLKSVDIPESLGWEQAAQAGLVDRRFADVLGEAARSLEVRAVNLRSWQR